MLGSPGGEEEDTTQCVCMVEARGV